MLLLDCLLCEFLNCLYTRPTDMTEIEIRGQFNGYAAYILDVLDKSLDPDMTVSRGLISFDCWYSQNSGSKPIDALVDYEIPHEYIKEWYLKHVKPLIKNGSLLENGEALPATLFGIVAKHNALPKIKPDEEEEEAISTCNSCGGRMKKKLESSGRTVYYIHSLSNISIKNVECVN